MRDDLVTYKVGENLWIPIKPFCKEFGIPTPKEDNELWKLIVDNGNAGMITILKDDGLQDLGACMSIFGLLMILANRPEVVMNDARLTALLPVMDHVTFKESDEEDDRD
ncbi:hypothetical protein AB0918_24615 [Streptomyces sp. NPDC006864]|uniref:hypothetical protein n=1 Tax=Streptomyces sp. NPDC006864 TaxID=3154780 RepID=UPI003454A533